MDDSFRSMIIIFMVLWLYYKKGGVMGNLGVLPIGHRVARSGIPFVKHQRCEMEVGSSPI